ncbi:hypothetical protein LTSEINV_0277, partial [Salmonella enterica subsp. enterica serovar Inverness str. R8-3668]
MTWIRSKLATGYRRSNRSSVKKVLSKGGVKVAAGA